MVVGAEMAAGAVVRWRLSRWGRDSRQVVAGNVRSPTACCVVRFAATGARFATATESGRDDFRGRGLPAGLQRRPRSGSGFAPAQARSAVLVRPHARTEAGGAGGAASAFKSGLALSIACSRVQILTCSDHFFRTPSGPRDPQRVAGASPRCDCLERVGAAASTEPTQPVVLPPERAEPVGLSCAARSSSGTATQIAVTVAAAASGTAHRQRKPDSTERKPDETTGGGSVRANTASISWHVAQSARWDSTCRASFDGSLSSDQAANSAQRVCSSHDALNDEIARVISCEPRQELIHVQRPESALTVAKHVDLTFAHPGLPQCCSTSSSGSLDESAPDSLTRWPRARAACGQSGRA